MSASSLLTRGSKRLGRRGGEERGAYLERLRKELVRACASSSKSCEALKPQYLSRFSTLESTIHTFRCCCLKPSPAAPGAFNDPISELDMVVRKGEENDLRCR